MSDSILNKYQQLANSMLDEIGYIVDPVTSEFLYVNDVLLKLHGLSAQDAIGQKYQHIICGEDFPCDYCKSFDLSNISDNSFSNAYHYNPHKDLHLALKVKFENIAGRKCIVATGVDISSENNKKQELELLSNLDKNIIKCANTLLSKSGQSMNELMQILSDYYGAARAYIYEADYSTMQGNCIVEYYSSNENAKRKVAKVFPIQNQEKWHEFLSTNDYLFSDDIKKTFGTDSGEYQILSDSDVDNFLIIPLKKAGKFFGFMGVDGLTANFSEPKLLMSVAAFVVDNIYKNKALGELEKTRNQLHESFELSQTIAECAKFLLEDDGTDSSITALLKTVSEFYDSEVAYIFELDPNERILRNSYNYIRENSGFVPIEDIDQDTLIDWVELVKERNMFHLEDVESLQNAQEYDFLKSVGVKSMLLVPLVRDGKRTGVLGCDNLSKNFRRADLLHTLSGFIMNDVQKKELINELEELSFTDKLTGLYNRNYYLHLIENKKIIPANEMGIIFADVNGLKKANDNLGHEYGDILLKWCSKYLMKNLNSPVCRIGGDEFVCFCENIPERDFELIVSSMRSELKKMPHQCMSIGSTWSDSAMDINKQIIETDKMMYLEKQYYYSMIKQRNLDVKAETELIKNAIIELDKELES